MADRSRPKLRLLVASVVVALVFVIGWLVFRDSENGTGRDVDVASGSELPLGARAGNLRAIDGLENVDTTIFALGSMWVVTSALADNFSPGEVDASIVRIDPDSSSVEPVIQGLGVQPTFAELGGVVWAKLEDRVVGFDADGAEVASFPWEVRGTLVAGEQFLWLTDFHGSGVTAMDPVSLDVVATLATDRFPVAPIVAFGNVWIPSSVDGTLTVIDESTTGSTTNRAIAVETESQLEVIAAIPGAPAGDEVWLTNTDGDVFAVGAEDDTFATVRTVPVDRPINRLYPAGDRVLMLPISGQSALVSDRSTGEILAEISLASIPVSAVIDGNQAWVSGDGTAETLSHIALDELTLVEQFDVGENSSNTTGPTQPTIVGDEVWVPNRGDDTLFAITR